MRTILWYWVIPSFLSSSFPFPSFLPYLSSSCTSPPFFIPSLVNLISPLLHSTPLPSIYSSFAPPLSLPIVASIFYFSLFLSSFLLKQNNWHLYSLTLCSLWLFQNSLICIINGITAKIMQSSIILLISASFTVQWFDTMHHSELEKVEKEFNYINLIILELFFNWKLTPYQN